MVHWQAPEQPLTNDWLALLLEPPEDPPQAPTSGTSGRAQHVELTPRPSVTELAGAPLHPPSTATTGRSARRRSSRSDVRTPKVPRSPAANVLRCGRPRRRAVKLASMIPASAIRCASCPVSPTLILYGPAGHGVFQREWGFDRRRALARGRTISVTEDCVREACAQALDVAVEGVPITPAHG